MAPRVLTNVTDGQLLKMIANGLTNVEIAAKLGVSLDTLKSRLNRTYDRLGVTGRAQAVAYAYQRGLIGMPKLAVFELGIKAARTAFAQMTTSPQWAGSVPSTFVAEFDMYLEQLIVERHKGTINPKYQPMAKHVREFMEEHEYGGHVHGKSTVCSDPDGGLLRYSRAIRAVLGNHPEDGNGWCLTCSTPIPCETVRSVFVCVIDGKGHGKR